MRPVRRNASPHVGDFDDHAKAKPFLISRLGSYCSYCERRIASQLAVEHIQPKGLAQYAHIAGRWDNFLLACVNCNSTKRDKDVDLSKVLLPDRDNTFAAYSYTADGKVSMAGGLAAGASALASQTLSLVGLDKPISQVVDENGKMVAIDRVSQRMEAWLLAQETKNDVEAKPNDQVVRQMVVRIAKANGFFSVWMTVFDKNVYMRRLLVDAFEGTASSQCFDPATLQPVTPAPNPDVLAHGGKA